MPPNRRACSPGLLAGLLLLACARSKAAPQAATVASPDASAPLCRALAAPGTPEARLAGWLPLQLGGALFVFDGTSPGAVLQTLEPFGLMNVRAVGCAPAKVVVFVPGASARDLRALEHRIVAGTGARTEASVALPPQRSGPTWLAGVCHAVVEPGSPTERFRRVFSLQDGGVVFVFAGTTKAAVEAAFAAEGLRRRTQVVACGDGDVVTFVSSVDASDAQRAEASVLANARGATTKERVVVAPEPPASFRD